MTGTMALMAEQSEGRVSAWSHWEVIQSRGMDQAIFSASYRIKR